MSAFELAPKTIHGFLATVKEEISGINEIPTTEFHKWCRLHDNLRHEHDGWVEDQQRKGIPNSAFYITTPEAAFLRSVNRNKKKRLNLIQFIRGVKLVESLTE